MIFVRLLLLTVAGCWVTDDEIQQKIDEYPPDSADTADTGLPADS